MFYWGQKGHFIEDVGKLQGMAKFYIEFRQEWQQKNVVWNIVLRQ